MQCNLQASPAGQKEKEWQGYVSVAAWLHLWFVFLHHPKVVPTSVGSPLVMGMHQQQNPMH